MSVDTVVVGRATLEQLATEMGQLAAILLLIGDEITDRPHAGNALAGAITFVGRLEERLDNLTD